MGIRRNDEIGKTGELIRGKCTCALSQWPSLEIFNKNRARMGFFLTSFRIMIYCSRPGRQCAPEARNRSFQKEGAVRSDPDIVF